MGTHTHRILATYQIRSDQIYGPKLSPLRHIWALDWIGEAAVLQSLKPSGLAEASSILLF